MTGDGEPGPLFRRKNRQNRNPPGPLLSQRLNSFKGGSIKRIPKIFLGIEKSRGYGRGLLRGISQYARIHGPWMFLTEHDFYHGGSRTPALGKGSVDGIVIREGPPEEMKKILGLEIPVIVACHLNEKLGRPQIVTDDLRVGQMGAEHFLACGFRHFAFCGTGKEFWSQQRGQSFADAVAAAGYTADLYMFPKAARDQQWGREQHLLARWLLKLPRPVAIMACTDDRARDVEEACELAGLKVPEEVAILGVDNDSLVCDMASVPLSSIALEAEKAGYAAGALLDRLMKGRPVASPEILVLPSHVEERRSTDILAVDDPVVTKAVRFIQAHVNRPLAATEVAEHAGLSERSLYDRFQTALGKSVFAEITRVRIAKIAWMLENTHLSIKEISGIMGMPDDKHLSRYFQSHKGVSPLRWRKQHRRLNPSHQE